MSKTINSEKVGETPEVSNSVLRTVNTSDESTRANRLNVFRKQLKAALLDLGQANYENIRTKIISALGYDDFRLIQNDIFKEIGTIAFEHSSPQLKQDWVDDCKKIKP